MDPVRPTRLVLPDSRLKTKRTVVRGLLAGKVVNWVRVYCANCGIPYGLVPEASCTFACWLCDPCAAQWGPEFASALMPEEVFWAKVHEEMLETHGRVLTVDELGKVAETASPLRTLLREGVKA